MGKRAKPPKARVIPREQEVQRGKKINLKCKISGRPLPIVRWLKDNKPIADSGRIRIRNSKKSSRLQIKRATVEDEGVYTCEVTNVVGTNYRDVEVSVAEPFEAPAHAVPCPDGDDYCLNGGKCFQVKNLGGRFCICAKGFTGFRCRDRDVFDILKEEEIKEAQKLDRVLTGLGLGITFLVICIIILAAYLLSKKKRKDYRRKQEQKRQAAMYKNSTKGAYSALPVETTVTAEKQKEPKPVMHNTTTQTEVLMNAPLLGASNLENKSSMPTRRSSLPSQLSKPPPASSSLNSDDRQYRTRLSAISATPDVEENRKQPKMAIVNAVVESDPEQHSKRSSPSQSSKTESAHGHLDQNPVHAKPGVYTDDNELGSKGDLSLDLDQRSDYDNQPPSDMEVNLESEADVHGLDASGDELDSSVPHGAGVQDLDSSETDSDDSGSSIGEEQALFQQLQSNPRVHALHENANLGNSAGNLSWDEYQHQPSFGVGPRQYPFNPYALDNDIMANRYFGEPAPRLASSQAKSLDDYDHELPYDPDPDATVV